ncbi:MAG TPA: hypothetical protein VFE05_08780 [Longimicrobiaceae bacterium]|jgi:hypothetical protein|nr:hypothetical protein [Longimicrobiaceae bacterium]
MRSLKLDIEMLGVESFIPDPSGSGGPAAHVTGPVYTIPTDDTGTIDTGPFKCSSLPRTSEWYPC